MKNPTLFLLAFCLAGKLYGQTGSSCTNPIQLPANDYCINNQVLTGNEVWYSFVANRSDATIEVFNPTDTNQSHIHEIDVFSGCPAAGLVGADTVGTSTSYDDTLLYVAISNLTPGNTYYIELSRSVTVSCRICQKSSAQYSMCIFNPPVIASACPNLITNGGFESGTNPDCSAPLASFSASLATGWSILQSPDYFTLASGTLTACLNFTPFPHTGSCHTGLAVGSASTTNYREFIQKQTNASLITGRTYKITFFYRRTDGNNASNIGVYVSGTQPSNAFSLPALPKFEYSVPGWVKLESYYTATSNAPVWLTIGGFTTASINVLNYFYIDDVSMVESPMIVYNGPTAICSGDNFTLNFSANNASPSYSWTCSPALSGFPSTNSTVTVNGPVSIFVNTVYTVTLVATTQSGCTETATYQFTIYKSPPVPVVTPAGPLFPCLNSTISLSTSVPSAYTSSIKWYLNNTFTVVATGVNSISINGNASGNYFVSISNGPCIQFSNSVAVTFVSCPTVTAVATHDHCGEALDGTVTANITGGVSPFTYLWNTSPVQTTATATGLPPGTYTVIVTDANGNTSTASATVVLDALPPAPIITTSATNLCGSTTITYTITNYNPSFTNTVAYNPTPTTVSNPSAGVYVVTWPSSCNNVTFTASVYNVNPVCIVSTPITVYKCCPCTNVINPDISINGTSQLTPYLASQLLSTYSGYPMISPGTVNNNSGNSGILYINGYFRVNVPLTITKSEVRFGANAHIDVAPGVTFTITKKSHLSAGCNDMWDGIYVSSTTATVVVNNSVIEDALNAIVSNNGGVFKVTNKSQFNKDYVGIVVKNYVPTYPGFVNGTDFTCYANYQTSIPSNALIAPYAGGRTRMGIDVSFMSDIALGLAGPGPLQNKFDYMDIGIHSANSNTQVFNSNFFNMTLPFISSPNVVNGVGIFAENGGSIRVGYQFSPQSICNFKVCGTGIFAQNAINVFGDGNKFKNIQATGIHIINLNDLNVVLLRTNDLVNMPNGIWCYNNPYTNIGIYNNTINVGQQNWPSGYGIVVQETFAISDVLKVTTIKDNDIKAVRYGIKVDHLIDRTIIQGNVLKMTNTPLTNPVHYTEGIYAATTTLAVITDNTISSVNNTADWWMNGIRINVASAQNTVTCNHTNFIGRGLYFDGPQPYTAVAKNDMNNGETGLLINGNNGYIDQQGFTNVPYDNLWLGGQTGFSFAQTYTYFASGVLSNFVVRPNPSNAWFFSYYPGGINMVNQSFPNPANFIPFSTTPTGNLNNYPCPLFNVPANNIANDNTAHRIIAGTTPYPQPDGAGVWMERYNLYRVLQSDTAFLNSDTLLGHFKDSCDQSNLGKLQFITYVANDASCPQSAVVAATATCGALCPVNIIEGHYKTINTIMLQHKGTNVPLSLVEINTIRNIATLCPLTDGPGVIYARSLMPPLDGGLVDYTNVCEQVPGQNSSQRIRNPQETNDYSFKLFPNPNNGIMKMDYSLGENQSGELTIYDITGKKINTYKLEEGENTLKIDEQKLEAGVYLYKVLVNGKSVQQDKIVIIK
ncbi:MAG: T9SS type A sorting domain-containing protein [Ilumatobacteraceae bacterium]